MSHPNPRVIVTDTRLGRTFKASRRTFAHLDYTIAKLAELHPEAKLVIIQTCYNDGVAASAGTHDFDAVFDFEIEGLDWWAAQWFLRICGWAAWYRHTGSWASPGWWHLHAVSLGYKTQVGIFVPGQVVDYYHHALGLKGQHDSGDDTSPFPPDIADTVFDYDAWMEDQMGYSTWTQQDKDQLRADLAPAVAAAVLGAIVDGGKLTLAQAVKQAAKAPSMVRQLGAALNLTVFKEAK